MSVSGASDKQQIDDENSDEAECADDDMQRLEAENAALARQIGRRDVTIGMMVTVIGFGHRRCLRKENRIGTATRGPCDLGKLKDEARSGVIVWFWGSDLLAFTVNEEDAGYQEHGNRDCREDNHGKKAGVALSELRSGIASGRFDLGFCGG
jgi:hypothetical protein